MTRMPIDTRTQNAWKELIDKEAMTRVSWHKTYKPNPNEDEWFKRAFYTQATSKPIGRSLSNIVLSPRPKSHYDRHDPLDELRKKVDAECNPNILKDMYPVKKEHKDVLFDGFSKEEKGRYKYLNLRKEIPPEYKYQYPVSNTMEYGWKLDESGQHFKAPTYARGKIVEESFYRRNGVL